MPTHPESVTALFEISYDFGFCFSRCHGVVTFDGDDFTFVAFTNDGEALDETLGQITPEGMRRVRGGLEALNELAAIEPVYGSPDAGDGGRLGLRFVLDGREQATAYDYLGGLLYVDGVVEEAGAFPVEFTALAEVTYEIVTAARDCKDNPAAEITACPRFGG